ncbi:MAG TPA: amidohydrolase, partial [Ilumatobacteraceae bacterium]|nr:amidohydrolase [Ilumatobacteraceae bacterium]
MHVDLLVVNGTVIDGSGLPRFRGDVAIKGEEVVAVGLLHGVTADRIIDAAGKVVAPGFIDPQTHLD